MKQGLTEKARIPFDLAYQTFKNLGIRYWCSIIEQQLKENITTMEKSGLPPTPVYLQETLLNDSLKYWICLPQECQTKK
jgi:hypothetical protein